MSTLSRVRFRSWSASSLLLALSVFVGACAHTAAPEPSLPLRSQEARAATFYERGVVYGQMGDATRAEQYLALALREGHDPEPTLRALVGVCLEAGRYRSALAYADPYLKARPEDVALRQLVSSIYLALREPEQAADELSTVLRSAPDLADAHFLLAVVLRDHLDRAAQARDHFARYLELAPHGSHASEARAALGERPLAARTARPGRST